MTACKNVSAAISAAFAPPIQLPSRNEATTPSSSMRAMGKACASGKAARAACKADLCRSCVGQYKKTCCTDSMLFGYLQAGHMRSTLSWLGWSLMRSIRCRALVTWKCFGVVRILSKLPRIHGCLCCATYALEPRPVYTSVEK